MTAMISDGRKLATRIFFWSKSRLMPTQKIRIDPTNDRLFKAVLVMIGAINEDKRVMLPCKSPTETNENKQPLPRLAVMTIMIIKSSTDLAMRVSGLL